MNMNFVSRKQRKKNILYTAITSVLLCTVFLVMVFFLYRNAQEEAYENLHVQTKQIKDDITLQFISDQENLMTMANFAAKLYQDGESYDILFASFKPIGLIENIGILNADNTFVTKSGSMDLDGLISFSEEAARGAYISGRMQDLTNPDYELVRSAVPITVGGKAVGVLYGVIKIGQFESRYTKMAQELDAQLFVYENATGNLVLDTIHDELGNISFLKDRIYRQNYSYENFISTDKGFSSFKSVYRDENVHMHYSTIEELGWGIALVRYDSQVFASMNTMVRTLLLVFACMVAIISVFSLLIMRSERRTNAVTSCASEIRKTLLETSGSQDPITEALKEVCLFTESRSAVFFDTDGVDYNYIPCENEKTILAGDRKAFMAELLRYTAEFYIQGGTAIRVIRLKTNDALCKTNPAFYKLLREHAVTDITFSATFNNANHVTILCVINSKRKTAAQLLAEKVSACFSMALYNQNQLTRTRLAATTDSLTGVYNRVAYKSDQDVFDKEKPLHFTCIYVDVNELHLRNNKYGHAAGDEMLLFIANSLKEVFFGDKVYRMGGDEFLVFCQNSDPQEVKKGVEIFLEQLKSRDYHVSIGLSYRSQNVNTEEMVREAEVRMYEEKAKYYQTKEQQYISTETDKDYVQTKTGIEEIDTMLSVLKEHYNGIYRVSLDTDTARRILMPAYMKYNETEDHFSTLFSRYVADMVAPDFHRALLTFQNYDALKQQLAEGKIPRTTFLKTNGETVVLSVYKLSEEGNAVSDTLWIFAKK